jgi:type IV pilus assembly protein PilV
VARTLRGAFLLEALIALLIFSFGLLAMAALHGKAVRHFNEAQFRSDAAEMAQATLANMRALDAATLATRFDSSTHGIGWLALLDQAKRLPGVTDTHNVPSLQIIDGPTTTSRQVTLDVFWQTPGDGIVHRYDASAIIGRN